MSILKELFIPNGETQVTAYESWNVRWTSRHGEFSGEIQHQMEIFPTKEGADVFANALREAFKLIKHTSGTGVIVTKN